MAKGISINFLADVRDFIKGTKDVEQELEQVADSLDDVAKDGEKSTERLEDSFKELAKATKKAGDDVGDNFKKGSKEAQRGLDDLDQNARSNAKEVAASFDGSIESIIDGFQGFASEAFEGWGPAGVAAGVAVAGGIGIATEEIRKAEENAKLAEERINELGLAIIDTGETTATIDAISDSIRKIITNADDARKKFRDIEEFARKNPQFADDIGTLAIAYSGNSDAIEKMTKKLHQEADALDAIEARSGAVAKANADRADGLREVANELQNVQNETNAAKEIEEAYLEIGADAYQLKADAIATINDSYDDAVNSVLDFVNEETGALEIEKYAELLRKRKQLLLDYQNALAESGFTNEQKDALNAMGVEAASALLQGLQSATPETRAFILDSLTEASSDASGVAFKELETAFAKPVDSTVKVKLDKLQAETDLRDFVQEREVRIKAVLTDRFGKEIP